MALDGFCVGGFWFFKFWIRLWRCLLRWWFELDYFKLDLVVSFHFHAGNSFEYGFRCIMLHRPVAAVLLVVTSTYVLKRVLT